MISREDIEKVNEATDIVSLVSEYVTLEKSGKNFKGVCPFHDDSNPSFYVSDEKKIAKCMVCGEGGRPIKFLMKVKNISFNQALKELSEKANIKLDIVLSEKKEKDYSNYYNIMQKSFELYKRTLEATESGKIAIDYLNNRGLDEEIIKTFGIGLSPSKPDILYNVLKDNNIFELDMLDLGLVNKSSNKFFDVFTKRIIFSIKDENHNIVAFSGRTYLDTSKKDEAKYVNSKETPIFTKGNVLYNLNNALVDIRRKNQVVLYEGFLDVIASYKANIKEAVCSMGTALTINQARLIKKYTNNVIICYDSDKAGIAASFKAINVLKQANLNVKLVLLPDNLDPDDYINKYSKEEYNKFFNENIIDPLEYEYKIITKDLNISDSSKVNDVKKEIFKSLNQTNSFTTIETYLKRFSDFLNISYESLKSDYDIYFSKQPKSNLVKKSFAPSNNSHDDYYDSLEQYAPPEPEYIPYNEFDIPYAEPDIPRDYEPEYETSSSYEPINYDALYDTNNLFDFLEDTPSKNQKTNNTLNKAVIEDEIKNILSSSVQSILRLINYGKESKDKALVIDSKIALAGINNIYQNIWMKLEQHYQRYDKFNQQIFFHSLIEGERDVFANDTMKSEKRLVEPYNDEDLEYCLDTLDICALENKVQDLDKQIKRVTKDNEKEDSLIQKIQYLRQRDIKIKEFKQKNVKNKKLL